MSTLSVEREGLPTLSVAEIAKAVPRSFDKKMTQEKINLSICFIKLFRQMKQIQPCTIDDLLRSLLLAGH